MSDDEFGNTEREIRMVAIAARARGDFVAERIALDRLALMERDRPTRKTTIQEAIESSQGPDGQLLD